MKYRKYENGKWYLKVLEGSKLIWKEINLSYGKRSL